MSVFETVRESRLKCVNAIKTIFLNCLMAHCKSNTDTPILYDELTKCYGENKNIIPLTTFKLQCSVFGDWLSSVEKQNCCLLVLLPPTPWHVHLISNEQGGAIQLLSRRATLLVRTSAELRCDWSGACQSQHKPAAAAQTTVHETNVEWVITQTTTTNILIFTNAVNSYSSHLY